MALATDILCDMRRENCFVVSDEKVSIETKLHCIEHHYINIQFVYIYVKIYLL